MSVKQLIERLTELANGNEEGIEVIFGRAIGVVRRDCVVDVNMTHPSYISLYTEKGKSV